MATNFGPRKSSIANFPIQIDIADFRINADLIKVSTFRLARQFGDMTWPLRQSVKIVIGPSMMTNIDVGGRPPWPPLQGDTVFKKSEKYADLMNPFQALVATGKLYETLESGHFWRITRDSADMELLDTVVPYAKYHQQGTRNVPQRQFAVLQQKDIEHIIVIFDAWIRTMTSAKDFWPYNHREL